MTNPDTKEEDSDFEKEKNKAAWNIMRTSWYTQGAHFALSARTPKTPSTRPTTSNQKMTYWTTSK